MSEGLASRPSRRESHLLGEWACLALVTARPSHGFAVAARLRPNGDVGRVWSLSRPLTYRALDRLVATGRVRAVAEESGVAGGTRTLLAATPAGRAALRHWLRTPVEHVRDLRSELLLKVVLADLCGIDVERMLQRQRTHLAHLAAALAGDAATPDDVVALWRAESSLAALRVVDRLLQARLGSGSRPTVVTVTER